MATLIATVGVAQAADLDPQCKAPTDAQGKEGCVCILPIPTASDSPLALLDVLKGEVLKSSTGAFTPVTKPTPLHVGDNVLVKADSTAWLTAGANCSQTIGPQASLTIQKMDGGCACAVLIQEKAAAAATGAHDLGPLLVVGGAAGGILALVLAGHPFSP